MCLLDLVCVLFNCMGVSFYVIYSHMCVCVMPMEVWIGSLKFTYVVSPKYDMNVVNMCTYMIVSDLGCLAWRMNA